MPITALSRKLRNTAGTGKIEPTGAAMGTVRDIRATSQEVMLDIDAELRYWRGCYRHSVFHRSPREFDDYIPTLKFGYDVYLLHYRKALDEVLPSLESRYQRAIPEWQRLDWPSSEAVIRETWKRMKSGKSWRPAPHPSRTLSMPSLMRI